MIRTRDVDRLSRWLDQSETELEELERRSARLEVFDPKTLLSHAHSVLAKLKAVETVFVDTTPLRLGEDPRPFPYGALAVLERAQELLRRLALVRARAYDALGWRTSVESRGSF